MKNCFKDWSQSTNWEHSEEIDFPRLISKFVSLYLTHSTLCWFWHTLVHFKIA